jgi:hypothetical protein
MYNSGGFFGVEIISNLYYKRRDGEKVDICLDAVPSYGYMVYWIVKDSPPNKVLVGDHPTAHIQGNIHSRQSEDILLGKI